MRIDRLSYEDAEYIDRIEKQFPFHLECIEGSHDGEYFIETYYAGTIQFGPSYFGIKVKDRNGNIIYDKNKIFGEDLSESNIFGDRHQKLVLVQWGSPIPDHERVWVLNLKTKEEFTIPDAGYYYAGHFYSFDGVYYNKSGDKDLGCLNLDTKEEFYLYERISKSVNNAMGWAISPIPNTIMVFTKAKLDNIILLDVIENKIKDVATLPINISNEGWINGKVDKFNNKVLFTISDYSIVNGNSKTRKVNNYYIISFS